MRFNVLQRNHGRLFHYVAEIAGQGKFLAFAAAERCLYEEYLTAYGCPCQTGDDAGE